MTRRIPWFLSCAVAGVFVLAAGVSPAAGALDLTGTWDGNLGCVVHDPVDGTAKVTRPVTIAVSRSGSDLDLDMDLAGVPLANGVAVEDPDRPGRGALAFLSCGATVEPLSFVSGHADVAVQGDRGVMKGVTTIAIPPGVSRCTFTLRRTSTADPGVLACP